MVWFSVMFVGSVFACTSERGVLEIERAQPRAIRDYSSLEGSLRHDLVSSLRHALVGVRHALGGSLMHACLIG